MMLALRMFVALLSFAAVSLTSCAHPNLATRPPTELSSQGAQPLPNEIVAADLNGSVKVPARPSALLPLVEQAEITPPEEEFDLEERFDELFAAITPAG